MLEVWKFLFDVIGDKIYSCVQMQVAAVKLLAFTVHDAKERKSKISCQCISPAVEGSVCDSYTCMSSFLREGLSMF